MIRKSYSLSTIVTLSIALSGCGTAAPTLTPAPPVPMATLAPALPGCDITGDTYKLEVRQQQSPPLPDEESFDSPDGSARVFQNSEGTYVDDGIGEPVHIGETHLGDGNTLSEWARWSHDGRSVAVINGSAKYEEALDIVVFDLDSRE